MVTRFIVECIGFFQQKYQTIKEKLGREVVQFSPVKEKPIANKKGNIVFVILKWVYHGIIPGKMVWKFNRKLMRTGIKNRPLERQWNYIICF